MKRMALATLLMVGLCVPTIATGQTVDAVIKKVTVYPDRALITRVVTKELQAGEQSIVINNLPGSSIDESFRVSAVGGEGMTLLGMNRGVELHTESPQQRVAELEKQIARMEKCDKQAIVDRLDAFQQQKNLLMAVVKNSGEIASDQVSRGTISVTQWDAAYKFVGTKVLEVNDSIRVTQIRLDSVAMKLEKLQSELGSLTNSSGRATKTVRVDLRLARAGSVTVMLEYVVPGATWRPLYDARLDSDTDLVSLNINAEVMQCTGEDWNNVELTLSTAVPSQGTGPGEFVPWYLSVVEMTGGGTADNLLKMVPGVEMNERGKVYIRGGRAGEVEYVVDNFGPTTLMVAGSVVAVSDYVTTFTAARKESVPSGDKAIRTSIGQYRLKGKMNYICRPHNAEGVFRIVNLTNQDEAPLMPGTVAIFVGSDFLGNANLPGLVVPGEAFELPFGRDNNIKVERRIQSDKKTQTSDKTKNEAILTIKLSNRSKVARQIDLEESLPISKDSRIKVTVGDILPKPTPADAAGKIAWKIDLAAGDSTTVTIPYRIEYSTDLNVVGR